MHANDLALLADSLDDLVVLLGMVDAVALEYGLVINVAETDVMLVAGSMTLPTYKTTLRLCVNNVARHRWTRSVAEDGRMEQMVSAIRECHEEGSDSSTTFRDFLKLPGHTKLIPWPDIRAAAAERALDRQAWRDAVKNLAPLEFEKPRQVGLMTRSCARRDGSG
eukprot:364874-Chlamydomonas_euryale.AAC.4